MAKLTAAKVHALNKPVRYGDGDTLFLNVSRGGTKSWIQRVTIHGKRRDIGLESYPVVILRRRGGVHSRIGLPLRTAATRSQRSEGRLSRHSAKPPNRPLRRTSPAGATSDTRLAWWQTLERHVMPRLGNMPVNRIGREDVLAVLTPIWGTRMETARRVRQRIRTILGWAMAHGFVEHNVVEAIAGALPAMPNVQEHHRALPYREVKAALATVEASKASVAAKLCLRFVVDGRAIWGGKGSGMERD